LAFNAAFALPAGTVETSEARTRTSSSRSSPTTSSRQALGEVDHADIKKMGGSDHKTVEGADLTFEAGDGALGWDDGRFR
jgi:hypothetical protein